MGFLLCYSLTSLAQIRNLCMTNGTEKAIYTHISGIDLFDWSHWSNETPYRPDNNFDHIELTPHNLYCQKEITDEGNTYSIHFNIAFSDTPNGFQWGQSRLKSSGFFSATYWEVEESSGNVIAGRQGNGEADTFTISRPH